jgi:serine/threonine protein kinase
MCQHPNIIKLIDLFENSDYYFIVLEYMQGKDLFDYLKAREFAIAEDRARELVNQITLSI